MICRATLAFALVACGKESAKRLGSGAVKTKVPAARAAYAHRNTLTDVRWILGIWRGVGSAGTVQAPFFERYSLANDSTLFVESFKDSTLAGVPDSTRYDLRGDSLGNNEAAVTSVSLTSLTFSSRRNPGLAWTWRHGDDNAWTAIIVTSLANGPPSTRVYQMARFKRIRARMDSYK